MATQPSNKQNYIFDANAGVANALEQIDQNGDLQRAQIIAQCAQVKAFLALNETLRGTRMELKRIRELFEEEE